MFSTSNIKLTFSRWINDYCPNLHKLPTYVPEIWMLIVCQVKSFLRDSLQVNKVCTFELWSGRWITHSHKSGTNNANTSSRNRVATFRKCSIVSNYCWAMSEQICVRSAKFINSSEVAISAPTPLVHALSGKKFTMSHNKIWVKRRRWNRKYHL